MGRFGHFFRNQNFWGRFGRGRFGDGPFWYRPDKMGENSLNSRSQMCGRYAMAMSFCSSVRPFVSLSLVKFVKLFARWQHMAASGGLSYRVRYTCCYSF